MTIRSAFTLDGMLPKDLVTPVSAAGHAIHPNLDPVTGEEARDVGAWLFSIHAFSRERIDHRDVDAVRSLQEVEGLPCSARRLVARIPRQHYRFGSGRERPPPAVDDDRRRRIEQSAIHDAFLQFLVVARFTADKNDVGLQRPNDRSCSGNRDGHG